MPFDAPSATRFVDHRWKTDVVPALLDYVRIPNKSPAYDREWERNGHMERAVQLVREWLDARPLDGMQVEVHRLPGRTPVIVVDVPATAAGGGAVLLYGHLDKQPEMRGWRAGLGPWEPVVDGERLYGRGAADDGYAAFAALTAVEAVRGAGGGHARCVVLIEASEESGSPDLPAHVEALAPRLGEVDLVVCLDSGCGTWDRLWTTTSLRGLVGLDLRVDILREGVHSGASGAVPSSFRILRSLLSRIEDERTGEILLPELRASVPPDRLAELEEVAEVLGPRCAPYPFVEGAGPVSDDPLEVLVARTWRAALSVTGAEGLPSLADAGNVLRPYTSVSLSMRTPPTADVGSASAALVDALTTDVPHGARVTVERLEGAPGWSAPPTAPWLRRALESASVSVFGNPPASIGEGGSIPFMGMLGERFPRAQFVVTGVLGPETNAHGPNEFLHLPTARRLTAAVAHLLDAHAARG